MLNKIKFTLLMIFTALIIEGCKNEMVGPDIEALGYPPSIKSALARSTDTIKTTLGQSIYFTAQFEHDVTWQLQLTGEETGAKYTISGVGSQVDQSNSTWSGQIDNGSKNFANENVKAVLSFPNAPNSTTSAIKFYIFSNGAFNNRAPVLVTDFTNTQFYGFPPSASIPLKTGENWPSEYGSNGLPTTNDVQFNPSLDGNKYAYLSGTPKGSEPKIYYFEMSAKNRQGGSATDLTFPLYTNPDLVYFNIDVYSTAPSPNTPSFAKLVIIFNETNGAMRQLEINQPSWMGWKRISIKYSDLTLASGFGKGSPDELSKIGFVFLSVNPDLTKKVDMGIDHPIFTFGKPF